MIGIICHDAGGAELISNYIIKNPNNYIYKISGPALKIFKKNIPNYKNSTNQFFFLKSKKIIIGDSWKKNYLVNFLTKAKKNAIKTILYLDHWGSEFKANLTKSDGDIIFPDQFWVTNKLSEVAVKKIFKNNNVFVKKNYYLENMKRLIKEFKIKENLYSKRKKSYNILYICEPIDDHFSLNYFKNKKEYKFTEKKAINFFFKNINKINRKIDSICFRPHPSENISKYDWVKKKYFKKFNISVYKDRDMIKQIMNADCLVGCNSFPLVLGVLAKKNVISNIPLKNVKCILPFKEIKNLNELN